MDKNTNTSLLTKKIEIDPDMKLSDFMVVYPQLVDVLMEDFGFHCANCIFAGFDTLKEGAAIHGIDGDDFHEMVEHLENLLNSDVEDTN